MKIFKSIREFFWPLLEVSEDEKPKLITPEEVNVNSTKLEKTLEYTIKRYEAEEDRRKNTETKASLFIGSISVVTTVIIGVTSVLIKGDINLATCIIVSVVAILTIYMARTIWFSIEALERRNYHTLSVDDFLCTLEGDEYYKCLIAEITNKMRRNYVTINKKVDSMTMAQEYFKRSIVTITIFSFGILIYFFSKLNSSTQINFNFSEQINRLSLNGWNIAILYSLVIFSIILAINGLRKRRV